MNTKRLILTALVVSMLLLSGCIGDGNANGNDTSPGELQDDGNVTPPDGPGDEGTGNDTVADELRDDFVEGASNITSYAHEGEITFETSAVDRPSVQITTTTTETKLDYADRELVSEIESIKSSGEQIQESNTTSYLVNGTVYERTVGNLGDSGWVFINDSESVNTTWKARDELGFYADFLGNTSVSVASEGQGSMEGKRVLNVEPGDEGHIDFLSGKLGDQADFFNNTEVESFSSTVWMSEDGDLLRAETNASVLARNQSTGQGNMDLEVDISFTDEFSAYNEPVEIEIPEEARDAEPLEPSPGIRIGGGEGEGSEE